MRRSGLRPVGANSQTMRRRIEAENIDISHFNSIARSNCARKSLNEVMVKNSSYNSWHLKARLLKAGIFKNECILCGQGPEWKNKPLTLHLDHINGVHSDNRLENLRIICPHCDSQLDTYKSKNRYHAPSKQCPGCGGLINRKSTTCRNCSPKFKLEKIVWPGTELLIREVENTSYSATARRLGVSDSAIRKRIKNHS
jgi:RNA polymerase subunit RPABC4/transcription elongation factor Spt4